MGIGIECYKIAEGSTRRPFKTFERYLIFANAATGFTHV